MTSSRSRPISRRRLQRMAGVLARRQPDLAVVIEDVHDPHNVSAVLRSCDATGVASAHLVYVEQEAPQLSKGVAASAQRWLDIYRHQTVEACFEQLRQAGMTIYATYLGDQTEDLYDLDLTQPSALVFGNEQAGVSDTVLELCDARVKIPMIGMVESLNISVATAVTLYEASRQRHAAGMYRSPAWSEAEMRRRLRDWLERDGREPSAVEQAEFLAELPPAIERRNQE